MQATKRIRLLILIALVLPSLSLYSASSATAGQVHSPTGQAQFASPQQLPNWSDPVNLESRTGADLLPTALQAADGTLWIAWQTQVTGSNQITIQAYDGIHCQLQPTDTCTDRVVSTAPFNAAPTLGQLQNGTIILVWSAGTNGSDDHLYYRTYNGAWNNIAQLTSGTSYTDESSKAIVTRDGTLWVFWERDYTTGARQVYYKTLRGNIWSPDTAFTTDTANNQQPTATVLNNGRVIWLTWVKTPTTGSSSIVYQTYNGTQWSSNVTSLTTPGLQDTSPDLIQDRNGTIWLFWSRPMLLGGTTSQTQLFEKASYNLGQTWSTDTNFTYWGGVNQPIDNIGAFAVQGVDTTVYVFFAANAVPDLYGFDIYFIQSTPIYPVKDAGISNVQVSATKYYPYGWSRSQTTCTSSICSYRTDTATIGVTIQNYGDRDLNVTVNVQVSNTTWASPYNLPSQRMLLLASLSNIFSFNWNLTGVHPGRYLVQVSIVPPVGQTVGNQLHDTYLIKSGIIILYAGDVLGTGIVNINNESVMGAAWQATPGSAKWNPGCDILRKGIVNINDEAVAFGNWQKSI